MNSYEQLIHRNPCRRALDKPLASHVNHGNSLLFAEDIPIAAGTSLSFGE
jgi:hypothetical protein